MQYKCTVSHFQPTPHCHCRLIVYYLLPTENTMQILIGSHRMYSIAILHFIGYYFVCVCTGLQEKML